MKSDKERRKEKRLASISHWSNNLTVTESLNSLAKVNAK
jgi:hypothetical protein